MERFDNDQIQSERRKQELDDLITTTNLQLKREIQILDDINNNVIGDGKGDDFNEDEIKLNIEKKESLIIDIEKQINDLTKLLADKNALEGLIGDNVDSTNSLIENLEVIPGYEKALDALLGDELYHSLDMKTHIHRTKNSITENTQSLPDGCKPLLDYVKGSDVLARDSVKSSIDSRNDTYYRHDIEGCPDLAKSVFVTPTAEDPWDPYDVFCRDNRGNLTHKDLLHHTVGCKGGH